MNIPAVSHIFILLLPLCFFKALLDGSSDVGGEVKAKKPKYRYMFMSCDQNLENTLFCGKVQIFGNDSNTS
jgi:hypothetical protein